MNDEKSGWGLPSIYLCKIPCVKATHLPDIDFGKGPGLYI